jgi:hypothetical protein
VKKTAINYANKNWELTRFLAHLNEKEREHWNFAEEFRDPALL